MNNLPGSQAGEPAETGRSGRYDPAAIAFWSFVALFSLWLMFKTFSFQAETGSMLVSSLVYSDFGSHLPLIRSFSWGSNFPPEFPVFSGPPIRYHYLFFMLVGLLEKAGLRIDLALNLPSIAGFTGLIAMIYLFGKNGYNDRRIGFLSVIFFLFNASLILPEYFKKHSLNWQTPLDIIRRQDFTCFGPWDGSVISAFWNLNIFINQRHLAPAFALVLLFIYHIWFNDEKKLWHLFLWGIIIGISPAYHQPSTMFFGLALAISFLFHPERLYLALVGIVSVVVLLLTDKYLFHFIGGSTGGVVFRPGYLMTMPVTLTSAFLYWLKNLGLHLFLIPAGLFVSSWRMRLIWLIGFCAFAAALTYQFSIEMAANHKMLNFFLILSLPLSARALITLWDYVKRTEIPFRQLGRSVCLVIFFLLIQGGIFDFFPIYNSSYATVPDPKEVKAVAWIKENTEPEARVLNNHFFFHPASIAGRKIFIGWPYFAASAGYNADKRMKRMHLVYRSGDFGLFCKVMKENDLGYVVFREIRGDSNIPEFDLNTYVEQLTPDFFDPDIKLAIYPRKRICDFAATQVLQFSSKAEGPK